LAEERAIPKTMSTQHPDNAGPPPWSTSGVIEGETELDEAFFPVVWRRDGSRSAWLEEYLGSPR